MLDELQGITKDKKEKAGAPKPKHNFPKNNTDIKNYHKALLENDTQLKILYEHRLLTPETIDRFELGWDNERICIPIREAGRLMNIRRYMPFPPNGNIPKMLNITGFGEARIWPLDNIQQNTIWLFEGEPDCLLANQLGLNAVTITGGAGTFSPKWVRLFNNKKVIVCYDIDEAGVKGAANIVEKIGGSVSEIYVVKLPITEPSNGDFTDFIKQGHTVDELNKIVESLPSLKIKPEHSEDHVDDKITDTTLDRASYEGLFYKRIRMRVRIIGKYLSPYILPRVVVGSCERNCGEKCDHCGFNKHGGKRIVDMDENRSDILSFIDCTTGQQAVLLKKMMNIISNCSANKIDGEGHQYIEQMQAIPAIDPNHTGSMYVVRELYILDKKMATNRDYEVLAITYPHPKTQQSVHIVYDYKAVESSIEEFRVTPDLIERLKIFQTEGDQCLTSVQS